MHDGGVSNHSTSGEVDDDNVSDRYGDNGGESSDSFKCLLVLRCWG